jgi:hypothetical protein
VPGFRPAGVTSWAEVSRSAAPRREAPGAGFDSLSLAGLVMSHPRSTAASFHIPDPPPAEQGHARHRGGATGAGTAGRRGSPAGKAGGAAARTAAAPPGQAAG